MNGNLNGCLKKLEEVVKKSQTELSFGYYHAVIAVSRAVFKKVCLAHNQRDWVNYLDLFHSEERSGILFLPNELEIEVWQILDNACSDRSMNEMDVIGAILESIMDPNRASVTGSFYTPKEYTEFMSKDLLEKYCTALRNKKITKKEAGELFRSLKISDPCCGSGGMLVAIAQEFLKIREGVEPDKSRAEILREIIAHNLYGTDINEEAVLICKMRLMMLCVMSGAGLVKLRNINAVSVFNLPSESYDLIIGNPPYLGLQDTKKIPEVVNWCKDNKVSVSDLYILITQKSYHLLKPGGSLIYLTSNTYFTDLLKMSFREFLYNKNKDMPVMGVEIVNLGADVFKGVAVSTAIFSFTKP